MQKTLWDSISKITTKWLPRLIIGGVVIAWGMTFFNHALSDVAAIRALIGAATIILWLMLVAVQHSREAVDKTLEIVKTLPRPDAARLVSLEQSANEIGGLLNYVPPDGSVTIDFLGYNLTQAWSYICDLAAEHPSARNVTFRVLCLDPEADLSSLPPKFADDARLVLRQIDMIEKQLDSKRQVATGEDRHFKVEIRGYRALPYVGGWRIDQPEHIRAHFVCFNGNRLEFGQWHWPVEYMPLDSLRKHDKATQYVAGVYDGLFQELYESELTRLLKIIEHRYPA